MAKQQYCNLCDTYKYMTVIFSQVTLEYIYHPFLSSNKCNDSVLTVASQKTKAHFTVYYNKIIYCLNYM